jgi:hypothetical protein
VQGLYGRKVESSIAWDVNEAALLVDMVHWWDRDQSATKPEQEAGTTYRARLQIPLSPGSGSREVWTLTALGPLVWPHFARLTHKVGRQMEACTRMSLKEGTMRTVGLDFCF